MDGTYSTVRELMEFLYEMDPDTPLQIRVVDSGCGCCQGDDRFEPVAVELFNGTLILS